jgi:uncharacterized RDD family membrane protein YckC
MHTSLEGPDQVPELWRNEVQSTLERYKRRRGRRIEGAFTMRFPFPPNEPALVVVDDAEQVSVPASEDEPSAPELKLPEQEKPLSDGALDSSGCDRQGFDELNGEAAQPQSQPAAHDELGAIEPVSEQEEVLPRVLEMPPRPQPRRKVIAFPSPSYIQQEAMRRIADPVQPEQLRILDVPEELQAIPATPFLDGLLEAPPALASAARPDMIDLPCASMQISARLGAALIDTFTVMAGMAVLVAVASRFMLHDLPATKFLIAGGLAISVLLWAGYQYLFLVYGGRTLGMKLTRTCLCTFKGRGLTFRQRQSRVMALYLSVLSLGMGVLWSLVDVDGLCWHDRISQTFPVPAGKS